INLIIGAWYLYWRSTQSLNTDALWFSIPLLFAEIYMYVGGVIFLLGLWKPIERRVKDLSGLIPSLSESDYPTVDVFITCYNEPVEIVEATAGAALQMDYPVNKLRVYILDDGNSSDMRAMAERLCLHDLESPELRHAASQLNTERYRLMSRFEQLQYLKGDLSDIDEWLSPQCLQVSTDYSELSTVMAWFNAMKSPIVPDEVWVACQTLLGEGFDNAICHAHKHLPSDTPIQLQLVILNYAVILHIWDQGLPFDLEERLQNLPDTIDENAERGRGLSILSQLTDHLAYVRTSDGKNCLTMIKKFLPQSVIDKGQCYQQSQQLQAIHQLLSLSRQGHSTSTDTLNDELQDLEQQITEKVSEMADLSRCRYIARIKPTDRPHHAIAGNINHAIFCGETHGDFILTLDADHIPKPQFLQRVLPNFLKFNLDRGHYELNRIAFVQTPQAFYNLPKSDPFGHDAHFFYGPIQQGKDGMNAAFYTGTNAILRREALVNMGLQHFAADFEVDEKRLEEFDLIGGLSSVSITEDMNTAMRLHSSGWRSAYHHEVLAEGLAPDDLRSTLLQKLRWAQGTIQVLLRDNPLLKPGLTFWQRIQYFQTMYSYFAGFFVAILLLCPIISFFTGLVPVRNFSPDFALHFVPAYLLNRLTLMAASQGIPMQELWRNEQYAIALFPLQIQAVWSVFTGRKITFQVTPKQRQSGVYLNLVRVQLLVCALTVAGMVWGLWQVISGQWPNAWTYIINVGWGCYHIALLWVVIRAAYWQPKPATESC
ncbi:MAG: glycosyltransferase family 2 protein, partial [Cyanobacteria bacterium J06633_2]